MESVRAELRFVVPSPEKPVNYPSEAGGRAEVDTGTADVREIGIADARRAARRFTLHDNGFELVRQPPPIPVRACRRR